MRLVREDCAEFDVEILVKWSTDYFEGTQLASCASLDEAVQGRKGDGRYFANRHLYEIGGVQSVEKAP